jgi:hypothetical protein
MTISSLQPRHPERVCWGCDRHCPADDLACGEDKSRAPHPSELCGVDWFEWETERSQHDADES